MNIPQLVHKYLHNGREMRCFSAHHVLSLQLELLFLLPQQYFKIPDSAPSKREEKMREEHIRDENTREENTREENIREEKTEYKREYKRREYKRRAYKRRE